MWWWSKENYLRHTSTTAPTTTSENLNTNNSSIVLILYKDKSLIIFWFPSPLFFLSKSLLRGTSYIKFNNYLLRIDHLFLLGGILRVYVLTRVDIFFYAFRAHHLFFLLSFSLFLFWLFSSLSENIVFS